MRPATPALPSSMRPLHLALAIAALGGCGALRDPRPATALPLTGSYDFELLEEVTGRGCATAGVGLVVTTLGAPIGGATPWGQAEEAAAFDALSRARGADALFVSRTATKEEPDGRVCAVLWGRAIRLRKGPNLGTTPPLPATPWPGGPAAPPPPAPAPASTAKDFGF